MKQAFKDVLAFLRFGGPDRIGSMPELGLMGAIEETLLDDSSRAMKYWAQRFRELAELYRKTGLGGRPSTGARPLAMALIFEEFGETLEALRKEEVEGVADGLTDLVYVVVHAAINFGIDLPAVWDEVQRANMAKFPDGRALRDASGKVTKPEGWQPPDVGGVLRRQGPINIEE